MQESGQQTLSAPLQDMVSTCVPTNITRMVTGFCAFLTKHQKRGNLLKSQLNFFFLHQSLLIAEDSNKRNNC